MLQVVSGLMLQWKLILIQLRWKSIHATHFVRFKYQLKGKASRFVAKVGVKCPVQMEIERALYLNV
jgi:hypothetical protein